MTKAPDHKTLTGPGLKQDEPLSRHTSFRVGGPADVLAAPASCEALIALIRDARAKGLPVTILGGGTNTLVSDQGIRGLVILLSAMKSGVDVMVQKDRIILRALAGERLSTLCRTAMEAGLTGLEWAAGIPGTLGGAVVMNAGSFGSDMAAVIRSVTALSPDTLESETLDREHLDFAYRRLDLAGRVILSADLILTRGDKEEIRVLYEKNLARKNATQPVAKASAGCFFENPAKEKPAGWLIEQAGLKGKRIGDAMISDRHANFIINCGNATFRDIMALKEEVIRTVHKKFKINLKTEVKTIGKQD